MIEIAIEKTRGGYPAIREHVNGDFSRSLIILNKAGKPKKSNNKKGLVRVEIGDLVIICIYNSKVNKFIIVIYEIVKLDTEQAYVKELNIYSEGIWSETLPSYLTEAVETAKRLASRGEAK